MPLLTIVEAAAQLATSRRTVEREIADGKLAVIIARNPARSTQFPAAPFTSQKSARGPG